MAENMEGKNLDEKVKNSLRKMIRSCDNYIKEAKNLEQLEDNLKHMEETDESFHKHELVQILSDQLESKLGDLIDRSVNDSFNSSKFEGDIDSQNRMAEKICHDIIKHKEFLEFKSTFQTSTNKAVDNLMKNFHANFIEMNINSDEVVTLNEQNEVKSISFSNDLEYSSPDNSMNQNSFVFVTSEQFPTIAQNLDLRKPEEVRMRAMHQLLAIPASDPQAADHWIQIRRYLIATLRDPCASIANLCLKLHSRTLASSHYKVSVEIYINLVEHLSEYFRDRELEKRALKPSGVVDFASPENSFILKIFRLTNDYAKDITTKWTRYPDSFVETIINETLKLLNLASDYKFGSFMTSLHFLSVIDLKAIWFTKWMHGNDSRKTLINSIKKQELFLQTAVNSVLQYASVSSAKKSDPIGSGRKKSLTSLSLTSGSNNSSSKRMQFRKAELDYTHFVHSLNVLKRILSFKNGRQLFPVKISNREITIKDLIKIFIQIIFDTSGLISSSEFSPSKCTYELLQDLCVTEETCEACLCNEEVIEQLLKPIKSLQMTSKKNQFASSSSGNFSSMNSSTPHLNHNQQLDQEPSSMLLVANILSKLASTQCGYKQLIFNDSRQNFLASTIKNSPARTIASFVEDALNNHISLPIFELAEYLYLARLLYSKCQGAFLIAEYSLNMCIADAWINCDSSSKKMPPAPSPAVRNHSSLSGPNTPRQQQPNQVMKDPYQLTWPEALLDNLVSMASTTKGVVYLNQTNLINPVANYLSTRYRSRMQVGKYEKFGYGFIISQLSNAPTGTFYLNECAFVQYLIEEIWTELAYGSDDFMSAFPRSYSVEPIDKEVYKPMLCLMNIASSFSSAYELLVNLTATPRAQYGVRDVPKGLVSLLDRVVFLDKKLKISSLCNYEQSHMFGLRLLGFLQSDLDILLLIESQYQSTRLLLNLQKSNRANNKGLCIDYENTNNTDSNMPSLNLQDNSEQLDEDDTETETYDVDDSAEKKDIIIDLLSVERNFVLVNSNIIGGPGEKLLPERYINDIKKIYKYPLFDQLPVPSYYIKKADYSKMKSSSGIKELIETFEFDKLIKGTQESQREWTNSFKTRLLDAIRSFEFKSSDIGKALGQFFKVQAAKSETTKLEAFGRFKNLGEFIAKYENAKSSIALSNIQKLGIEKTIQYGIQIGLLDKSNRDEYTNNLTELHKQLNVLLKRPNRKSDDVKVSSSTTSTSSTNPTLAYCDERNYPGYDWFASLLFLLNSGETNATLELLINIASSCLSTELLWPAYQYARGDNSGVSPLLATTCHYVELILKTEQPLVFSAFRMSGLTPAQICMHWIKQCFLNHIDWPEIVAFLVAELVLGIDYQTYFCVVLLKHMNGRNQSIVQHHTNRDLQFFLRGNQIENFKVTDYLEYMHEMEGKYRHYIDEDVQRTFDKIEK